MHLRTVILVWLTLTTVWVGIGPVLTIGYSEEMTAAQRKARAEKLREEAQVLKKQAQDLHQQSEFKKREAYRVKHEAEVQRNKADELKRRGQEAQRQVELIRSQISSQIAQLESKMRSTLASPAYNNPGMRAYYQPWFNWLNLARACLPTGICSLPSALSGPNPAGYLGGSSNSQGGGKKKCFSTDFDGQGTGSQICIDEPAVNSSPLSLPPAVLPESGSIAAGLRQINGLLNTAEGLQREALLEEQRSVSSNIRASALFRESDQLAQRAKELDKKADDLIAEANRLERTEGEVAEEPKAPGKNERLGIVIVE